MDPHYSSHLTVRLARESDQPAIVRLCRRAVSRYDYVIRILHTVINRGGLFLAWDGAELAGMTNFDWCMDGSGWLSMARTDPAWRRRGVAIKLQGKIAAYARRRSVRTLRLWITSGNTPSVKAAGRVGFRQICEAAHISCRLKTHHTHRKIPPSMPTTSRLQSLLKSSYVARTRGYIGYKRHFMEFRKPLLAKLCNQGDLYVTDHTALLVSGPDRLFRVPQCSLAILEGPMAESLNRAKEIAQGMRAQMLSSYIPYNPYQISVAKRLGFTRSSWGKHCLVYEKKI